MEFMEKVMAVQSGLKAPKGQYNSFGKYSYRSCEDILEAVKPLLKSNGLIINVSDEIIEVGGRVYVKATASLFDTASNNVIAATAFAREPDEKKGMDASQVTGTASSYARKYALNGLLCIDDTKDADADETPKNPAASNGRAQRPAPADNQPKLICQHCGKEITGKRFKGQEFTPFQIAQSTAKKYGEMLCWSCSKEVAAQEQSAPSDHDAPPADGEIPPWEEQA